MESKKPEVFISYSADDRSYAKTVADRLRAVGIEPWLDTATLGPWVVVQQEIEAVLSQCRTCLVIVDFDSHIDVSFFIALKRRIEQGDFRVIPVLLPGVKWDALSFLPDFLHSVQGLEFQQLMEDDTVFQRVLDVIKGQSSDLQPDENERQQNSAAITGGPFSSTLNAVVISKKIICLPDIDWVEIPAGPFIYGEKKTQQTIELPRFYISRYPVTNRQYQTFIDAGGYSDERWWLNLKKEEAEKPEWKHDNRPREYINWYEAVAFTRWLSAQLGYDITLPTEQQWEKAARGTDGRKYPWGEGYNAGDANIEVYSAGDDNLQQTTAVGMYPHRGSPYGVMDMLGNIWEWCLNQYDEPMQLDSFRTPNDRMLRGGSWDSDDVRTRCSSRKWSYPFTRLDEIGFRVVCTSPPTEH